MAWHEKGPLGNYFICLRVGDERFRRSLKTDIEKEADGAVTCVEENLRLLERGRLELPSDADVVSFLLSNGRVTAPVTVSTLMKNWFSRDFGDEPLSVATALRVLAQRPVDLRQKCGRTNSSCTFTTVPEQITLRGLFTRYFASIPEGNLENTTVGGMKTHQNHLERYLGQSFLIRTLTLDDLQEHVNKRSHDEGMNGKVTGISQPETLGFSGVMSREWRSVQARVNAAELDELIAYVCFGIIRRLEAYHAGFLRIRYSVLSDDFRKVLRGHGCVGGKACSLLL